MQNEGQLTTTLIDRIDLLPRARTSISRPPTRCNELKHMIGNTPLLAVRFRFKGRERVIYAKAEHINMTGSIKDRMALHILKKAYDEGHIQPGDTIAEATSGNTGISFAAIGRALGHQVVIFMPDLVDALNPTDTTEEQIANGSTRVSDSFGVRNANGRRQIRKPEL